MQKAQYSKILEDDKCCIGEESNSGATIISKDYQRQEESDITER